MLRIQAIKLFIWGPQNFYRWSITWLIGHFHFDFVLNGIHLSFLKSVYCCQLKKLEIQNVSKSTYEDTCTCAICILSIKWSIFLEKKPNSCEWDLFLLNSGLKNGFAFKNLDKESNSHSFIRESHFHIVVSLPEEESSRFGILLPFCILASPVILWGGSDQEQPDPGNVRVGCSVQGL